MKDNGVCRTAPATPGLLIIVWVRLTLSHFPVQDYGLDWLAKSVGSQLFLVKEHIYFFNCHFLEAQLQLARFLTNIFELQEAFYRIIFHFWD